jgi:hypothetical protein
VVAPRPRTDADTFQPRVGGGLGMCCPGDGTRPPHLSWLLFPTAAFFSPTNRPCRKMMKAHRPRPNTSHGEVNPSLKDFRNTFNAHCRTFGTNV